MGIGDGTTLRGARAEVDIPFSIGRQQIVSEARLDLHVRHSDKLPADARLEVLLNGETLDDLRLTAGEPLDDFVEIAVNPPCCCCPTTACASGCVAANSAASRPSARRCRSPSARTPASPWNCAGCP
ncbi:cellulose biosynthesis cyclic di-GMP-binding regulatory protein BcsB [Azotobacter vinelandii]